MSIAFLNGVPLGNIAEVNGVPIGNIAKINGQDVVLAQVPASPTNLTLTPVTGPAVLFEDTFTGPDQLITLHVPSPGPGAAGTWSDTGISEVASNQLSLITQEFGEKYTTMDAGASDCVVRADIEITSGVAVALAFRYLDVNNHWIAYLNESANQLVLYEKTAGGNYTDRGNVTMTIDTDIFYDVEVTVSGSDITYSADGNSNSFSSTAHQAETGYGFYGAGFGAIGAADNFKVTELP